MCVCGILLTQVAVYQEKLRELEDKQNELIIENMELKELCLFLDQERVRMTGDRDEGDGSSNGTVTGHEDGIAPMDTAGLATANLIVPIPSSYPICEYFHGTLSCLWLFSIIVLDFSMILLVLLYMSAVVQVLVVHK